MIILRAAVLIVMTFGAVDVSAKDQSVQTLKSSDGKEWILVEQNSLMVSKSCLKSSCLALKPYSPEKQSSRNKKKSSASLEGHPAANFCEAQRGKYISGVHKNGDEDGICVFKDGSYIFAWDLFQKNQSKKVLK